MKGKYIVILFKNKERYKIIKNYQTYKNSKDFFNKKINESNDVVFDIQTEAGEPVVYELGLVSRDRSKNIKLFKQDDFGRNIQVETDDPEFTILELKNYKISEKVYDIDNDKKINSSVLVDYISKGKGLKLISKLNNKIIIQEDSKYSLYSLKNEYDADRFLGNLESYIVSSGKRNCLIVKDSSKEQKKYLYNILTEQGYDKKMLYRKHTTYSKDR